MFIRPCHRTKNGKRHAYWALVESIRTDRGPRQRTVAYLGQLDENGRLGVKRAAEGNKQPSGEDQLRLWEDDSPAPEWVEVDTANELESLSTNLSRKIWQKIMILDRAMPDRQATGQRIGADK